MGKFGTVFRHDAKSCRSRERLIDENIAVTRTMIAVPFHATKILYRGQAAIDIAVFEAVEVVAFAPNCVVATQRI
ncbi:hypothetical protein BB8028_0006g04020 [Beauveria bassiana]|uniref:Uncharacterized protein n=1 Tax=Beauveria bassiana TaxID=176275 RepID=A0A2S7YIS4_BEABA|nr:hypothetical protein BB8028_0006g04020 [Beauveria bassiana]